MTEPAAPLSLPRPLRAPARLRHGLVGYAPGAFDTFHIGHLNLLRRASLMCDYLIAGVVSDEVATAIKHRRPVAPQEERLEIVRSIDVVDEAQLEEHVDKVATWEWLRFDILFKGSDWQGTERGDALEASFAKHGVRVVYLPYTQHVSSTLLRALLDSRSSVPG